MEKELKKHLELEYKKSVEYLNKITLEAERAKGVVMYLSNQLKYIEMDKDKEKDKEVDVQTETIPPPDRPKK